jgi:hypothetical protein
MLLDHGLKSLEALSHTAQRPQKPPGPPVLNQGPAKPVKSNSSHLKKQFQKEQKTRIPCYILFDGEANIWQSQAARKEPGNLQMAPSGAIQAGRFDLDTCMASETSRV